jgi:hypothetical protein
VIRSGKKGDNVIHGPLPQRLVFPLLQNLHSLHSGTRKSGFRVTITSGNPCTDPRYTRGSRGPPKTQETTKVRCELSVIPEGTCVKRTTHDFHTGNAFPHGFDLRKYAMVICVNPHQVLEEKMRTMPPPSCPRMIGNAP